MMHAHISAQTMKEEKEMNYPLQLSNYKNLKGKILIHIAKFILKRKEKMMNKNINKTLKL